LPRWLAQEAALLCVSCAEFNKICSKTAIGFVVMGFIGFFVKLIFIVSPCCQPPSAAVVQQRVAFKGPHCQQALQLLPGDFHSGSCAATPLTAYSVAVSSSAQT
jgi:hypothetical protein